ncbi:Protein of uncharacterised function (DUF539) [Klebsiella michiganensis]|uniref:Protein of uncharacterized function (DUF539) n=1 Tax=Klebsiella michiganensis TaxID=1134687 RepID=A0A7H4N6X6_9ENTR|nr:Protein of uncharacterised function (DUF539) [Klebsiella michiganensis]
MLTVFVATFVIFALVILGMSLGYLIKRKSIQGSCGGISSLGMEKVCDCPEPCDARKKTPGSRSAAQAGSHPIISRPHRAAFFDLPGFRFRRRVYHHAVGAKLACGTKIIGTINAEEDNMGFAL